MKLSKTLFISCVASMLMATSVWAGGEITIIKQLNGTVNDAAGTVTSSVSEGSGQCTLTVTPAQGNYITAAYITAERVVNGGLAQSRLMAPGINNNSIEVVASGTSSDPSGQTTYTFDMPSDDYDVEVVANFQTRTSIANASVTLEETSFNYDGEAKEPAVTLVMLGNDTIYTYSVSYSNNINAGTATVTVAGQGMYTGEATAEFTINKAALDNLVVYIAGWTYGEYDEELNAPAIEGYDGNGDVTYTYASADIQEPSFSQTVPTNAGNYIVKATVAETDNYAAGEATENFTIAKAELGEEVVVNIESWTYGDEASAPSVDNAPEGAVVSYAYITIVDDEEQLSDTAPTNAGSYIIKATITETANYLGGEVFNEFNIDMAALSEVVIGTIADQTYTGDPIEPTVTVTFNGNVVDESEYQVEYDENNVDVGTVTVTIISNEINFYNEDEPVSTTFEIVAAQADITAQDKTVTYDGTEQQFDNYTGDEIEVIVMYYASESDRESGENEMEVALNAGTYYVKLVSGEDNYTFEPVYATFTIEPKTLTDDMLWTEGEEFFIYDGQPKTIMQYGLRDIIDEDEVELEEGEDKDFTLEYSNNINVGTATATFTGHGNYQGTVTLTYDIMRELNITLSEVRNWATYYADEDLQLPEGMKAYIVTGIGQSEVIVSEISYIPQHVGVLLTYDEEIPDNIASAYTGATQEIVDNMLEGTSVAKAVSSITDGTVYVLYNNEFVKSTTGTIPANRAYLVLDDSSIIGGPESRSLTIVFGEEETGIDVVTGVSMTNGQYYNLQGMRMTQPQKGLVIVNGKKLYVK